MYERPFGCKVGCEVLHIGTLQTLFPASQYWVDKLKRISSLSHLAPTDEIRKSYKLLAGIPPLKRKTVHMELINPLNPELNPICYLLALLGPHHFLHVNRIRVKLLTFRLLMSYIYGAPILDVSRSHTTTQHSR